MNTRNTFLRGVLHVNNHDFIFEMKRPSNENFAACSFNCDWELKVLLHGYEGFLKKRLQSSKNEEEFLSEIHSLAAKLEKIRQRRLKGVLNVTNVSHQSVIIKELEMIGWDRLVNLDPSFSSLTLSARDSASREHLLHLKFNPENSAKRPTIQTDLPATFKPKWSSQDGIFKQVYEQFIEELSTHQDFWEILDEFDEKCWVLEPETRSRSCSHRRVAIGSRSSLLVILNPLQPRALPECRFLGADEYVSPLLEKWNHGLFMWDKNKTVLTNLQEILDVDFPAPTTASLEDFSMDCCICYAYKLNDEVPEVTCSDTRCGQMFHSACLIEWIRSLPNFRQSFNVLFGECPYCSTPLTVKICKKAKPVGKR